MTEPRWGRGRVRLGLAMIAGGLAILGTTGPARAGLDEYVKKPDAAFAWSEVGEGSTPAGKYHRAEAHVAGLEGDHLDPFAVRLRARPGSTIPTRCSCSSRGRITARSPASTITSRTSAWPGPAARGSPWLFQVPNQPLLDGKEEDELIAETFVRYLQSGDEEWPLLFPMVKSAVRAMDAVQAWARESSKPAARFVVTGGSKRGWTTWLTGAVDDRVVAIAPMVIVMLNLGKQGANQLKVWGQYSEQIHDYVERGLMEKTQTPSGTKLWKMVDPYTYRGRLAKPKLLINGTNDRYWTLDALDFYWDGLKGPKYLIELPNAGHGLDQNREWAISGLGAFFRHTITGRPMPRISWAFDTGDRGEATLTIRAEPAPKAARLWTAKSASRDFRESRWESRPLKAGIDHRREDPDARRRPPRPLRRARVRGRRHPLSPHDDLLRAGDHAAPRDRVEP